MPRINSSQYRNGPQRLAIATATAGICVALADYAGVARAANITDTYTGSSTGNVSTASNWSLGTLPTVTNDAVFPSTASAGVRNWGVGVTPGANLTVGSFNVLATTGTFTLRNDTSSASTASLTLGGAGNLGNGVSGNASDLLYAASGSTFAINGVNGSNTLNVILGQSGNFNAAGSISITSAISEASSGLGITKTGAGTLTLGGANSYTGPTTVNNGMLALTGSLNSASALTFSGSGTFNRTSPAVSSVQSLGVLTFNVGDGNVQSTYGTGGGNEGLSFASLGARGTGATGNFVASGGTNGTTNKISLTGQGTGFIDTGMFFAGGTTGANYAYYDAAGYVRGINFGVDAGTSTTAVSSSSIGSTTYAQTTNAVTAQDTATFTGLNLVNTTNTAKAFTLAAGKTVTTNGILRSGNGGTSSTTTISGGTGITPSANAALVIRTDMANDLLTISTPLLANGTNTLVKSGTGTLTLGSTANNLTGGLYLNSGILSVSADGALGATSAPVTFNGGTLRVSSGLTIGSARTITVNPAGATINGATNFANATVTVASALTGSGLFNVVGNVGGNSQLGTAIFSGDNSGLTGGISMDRGTIELDGFNAAGSNMVRFTSTYSADTLRLRSDSAGTFTTAGLNLPTYQTNATATINVDRLTNAGSNNTLVLKLLAMSNTGGEVVNVTGGNGYALRINAFTMVANGPSNTVGFNPTSANLTVDSASIAKGILVLGGAGTSNSVGSIVGTPSDPGGLRVTGGTWTLTAANTYGFSSDGQVGASSGGSGTEITGGKLVVSADNNLGYLPSSVKSRNININGGTLGAADTFAIGTNRGIGIGPRTGTTGGAATIDVADTKTLTYNGIISAAGNTGTNTLSKTGLGTLSLGGANSFNGTTTITGGTLKLVTATTNNIASSPRIAVGAGATFDVTQVTGSGGFALASGQTLAGEGTVTGSVAVGASATIAPGSSPGTLSTGAQSWNSGGAYDWEINNVAGTPGVNWDLLQIGGALAVNATSASTFTINVRGLAADNQPGNVPGFVNGNTYHWLIADSSAAIASFAQAKFVITTTGVSNAFTGVWYIQRGDGSGITGGDDTQLYMSYSTVPEPTAVGVMAAAGLLGLRRRRVG